MTRLALIKLEDGTVLPQTGNVPVFRGRPTEPVAYATVDEWILPLILRLGPWYLSDMRQLTCPRVILRDDHMRQRNLTLNRCVAALARRLSRQEPINPAIVPVDVWREVVDLPPIHPKNTNQFDCTLNNLNFRSGHSILSDVGYRADLVRPEAAMIAARRAVAEIPSASYDVSPTDPLSELSETNSSQTVKSVLDILTGK